MCADAGMREARVAIKISVEQWLLFDLSERRRIREHPITTKREPCELADFIRWLVRVREGVGPEVLLPEQRRLAFLLFSFLSMIEGEDYQWNPGKRSSRRDRIRCYRSASQA